MGINSAFQEGGGAGRCYGAPPIESPFADARQGLPIAAWGSILRPMVEEPIAFLRASDRSAARTDFWSGEAQIRGGQERFDRRELAQILRVYGRMVAAGEWRDYAIDFLADRAVFSIFRHCGDLPLFTIEKQPALKDRQGQYAICAASGHVLKRGRELALVLRLFDRKWLKALKLQEA
jgi:hypothetical protein